MKATPCSGRGRGRTEATSNQATPDPSGGAFDKTGSQPACNNAESTRAYSRLRTETTLASATIGRNQAGH